jgi:hypothetical protein
MKANMKKHKWKIALATIVIIGLFFSFYWRDQALSAQAIALDQPPQITLDEKDNGYFYLLGLTTEKEKNPAEAGKTFITQYETLLRAIPPTSAKQLQQLAESPRLQFVAPANDSVKSICRVREFTCVEKFSQAADKLKKIETKNRILVERYETLLKYPQYAEVISPSMYMPSPSFGVTQNLNDLHCAHAAVALANGDIDAALDSLASSIRFWHNNVRGSTTLISRLIASANLKTDYYFLNDFLDYKPAIAQSHFNQIESILAHLSAADTDLTQAIKGKFRYGARFAKRIAFDTDGLLDNKEMLDENLGTMDKVGLYLNYTPLYRPNASLNRQAEIFDRYLALAALPAAELLAKKAAVLENLERDFNPDNHKLRDYTYNPLGYSGISLGLPSFLDYMLSAHELDGYVRLLKLKLNIRKQSIPLGDMPRYLATSDAPLFNPFTKKPMSWDTADNKLYFKWDTSDGSKPIAVGI